AHAGGRLIEQDHAGAAGDRHADLQRALLGVGQQARLQAAPPGEVEVFQQSAGILVQGSLPAECVPERISVAAAPQKAAADVLKDAELMEDRGNLKTARQA